MTPLSSYKHTCMHTHKQRARGTPTHSNKWTYDPAIRFTVGIRTHKEDRFHRTFVGHCNAFQCNTIYREVHDGYKMDPSLFYTGPNVCHFLHIHPPVYSNSGTSIFKCTNIQSKLVPWGIGSRATLSQF